MCVCVHNFRFSGLFLFLVGETIDGFVFFLFCFELVEEKKKNRPEKTKTVCGHFM